MLSASIVLIPASFRSLGQVAELANQDGRPYRVALPRTDHVLLVFGQKLSAPAAQFEHPNLLSRQNVVHEFKHDSASRGKYWTSQAGVDLFLAIPTDKILLLPEAGYSYVRAEINGVKVILNVSGGSAMDTRGGWMDWVGSIAHVSVGHSVRDLKKVAAVATSPDDLRAAGWTWAANPLDAKSTTPANFVKAKAEIDVRKILKAGDPIIMGDNASGHAGETGSVHRFENSPFCLQVVLGSGGIFGVRSTLVDWPATAAAIGVTLTNKDEVQKVSFMPPAARVAA